MVEALMGLVASTLGMAGNVRAPALDWWAHRLWAQGFERLASTTSGGPQKKSGTQGMSRPVRRASGNLQPRRITTPGEI